MLTLLTEPVAGGGQCHHLLRDGHPVRRDELAQHQGEPHLLMFVPRGSDPRDTG